MRKLASVWAWGRFAKQFEIGEQADDCRSVEGTSANNPIAPSLLGLHDNHWHLAPLIVRVERPRRAHASQRTARTRCWAAVRHSMRRSARSSTDCGIVSPSAFAVFMLMTS